MRALLLIAAVILLFALAGWITFSTGPNRSTINLETQTIKQDTQRALESSSDALRRAGEEINPPPQQADSNQSPTVVR